MLPNTQWSVFSSTWSSTRTSIISSMCFFPGDHPALSPPAWTHCCLGLEPSQHPQDLLLPSCPQASMSFSFLVYSLIVLKHILWRRLKVQFLRCSYLKTPLFHLYTGLSFILKFFISCRILKFSPILISDSFYMSLFSLWNLKMFLFIHGVLQTHNNILYLSHLVFMVLFKGGISSFRPGVSHLFL